jgi:hypothetical protein
VTVELGHEALAEAHDLVDALALGVEVRSALAAAHGEAGESVLEGLLESEELQNRFVDRGVESDSALVRADRIVVLHPVAALDPDIALVVLPADPERDHPVGLGHSPQDLRLMIFGLALGELEYVLGDFLDRLDEFGLTGVAPLDPVHETVEVDMVVAARHSASSVHGIRSLGALRWPESRGRA